MLNEQNLEALNAMEFEKQDTVIVITGKNTDTDRMDVRVNALGDRSNFEALSVKLISTLIIGHSTDGDEIKDRFAKFMTILTRGVVADVRPYIMNDGNNNNNIN